MKARLLRGLMLVMVMACPASCRGLHDETSVASAGKLTYRDFPVDLTLPEVDAVGYEVELSVSGSPGQETFQAVVKGTYVATNDLTEFTLDFDGNTVTQASVDGELVTPRRLGQQLVLPLPHPIAKGRSFTTRVAYQGVLSQSDGTDPNDFAAYGGFMVRQRNAEGRRIFTTLSWPSKARRWLPLRDHPRDAAQVAFSLTWPASFTVLANGRRVRVRDNDNGTRTWRYEAFTPMPTYDVHIAAYEPWDTREASSRARVPIATFTYAASKPKFDAIYRDIPKALDVLEGMYGAYRWGTLTFIEEPIFGGGMEHATVVSMDETLTKTPAEARATAFHELAHHWSGNLVRFRQWNDFWLSEGFADYLTGRVIAEIDGADAARDTWRSYLKAALDADKTNPHALAPAGAELDVLTIFDAISYQRGALTLRMLEHMLGEAPFTSFLKAWFDRHAFGSSVSTEDFKRELEAATGKDLTPFFETFVRESYHPELRVTFAPSGAELELTIEQLQPKGPAAGFRFPLDLELVSASGERERVIVELTGKVTTKRVRPLRSVSAVVVDPDETAIAVTACSGPSDTTCKPGYKCLGVRPRVSACLPR